MTNNSEILEEIKRVVLQVDFDAEVVLFGSRARGDFHEESDWDLLVLVDKEESDFNLREKYEMLYTAWNWNITLLFRLLSETGFFGLIRV